MRNTEFGKKANTQPVELIILDLDDSLIKHRTVAAAYSLFFQAIQKLKLGRLLVLGFIGVLLNLLYYFRRFCNRFICYMSNRLLILIWSKTVVFLKIKKQEYIIEPKLLPKSQAYARYQDLVSKSIGSLSKVYKIGITQSFCFEDLDNPVKELLGLDEVYSNIFITKDSNGLISGAELHVSDKTDKRIIAEKVVKKISAKSIAVFIDDYDDLDLLKLDNILYIWQK